MASVAKHSLRTRTRSRSVVTIFALIAAIALLRLSAGQFPGSLWILAAMLAATVLIAWRTGLRADLRRTARSDLLKTMAGSQAVVLLAFYPLWVALSLKFPASLIVLCGFIPVHLVVSVWTSLTGPIGKESRSFRLVEALLPIRMAPLAHAELAILWMALFTWTKPKIAPTERSFTSYGTFAAVLVAIVTLSIVEIGILHLILGRFSADAAWIGTAIGVLALIYVVGVLKSLRYRPTIVRKDGIVARLGLLHDLFIPATSLAHIGELAPGAPKPAGAANFAGITPANIMIELQHPVLFKDRLGKQRNVRGVALHVDDPAGLIKSASCFATG